MDLKDPSKSTYTSMLSRIRDIFTKDMPNIATSVGSAVYELIVRPLSIVYASIQDSLDKDIRKVSLDTLSTSTNTEAGDADHILSNYFVTRNGAKNATGVITVASSSEVTRVPQGSAFTAAGVSLVASVDTIGVTDNYESYESTDTLVYSKATKIGDSYYFTVPVESTDQGVVVSAGTPAEVNSNLLDVSSAIVSSSIEGGSRGETDAEMIERARVNLCSWQGGSRSIHKILTGSGIKVYSSISFDSADPEMSQVADSPVLIGTGGMIDTYVKTAQYPLSMSIDVLLDEDTPYAITDLVPPGILSVVSIVDVEDNQPVPFTVTWGSDNPNITAKGARFSSYQTAYIEATKTASCRVTVEYMPGIKELQEYIDRKDIRVLGTSIVVKAAIPSTVRVSAKCATGGHSIDDIKGVVKNYINNLAVGSDSLDMANAQESLSATLPGASIKHPISMKVTTTTYTGYKTIVGDSISGVVSSEGTDDVLTGRVRFFCISDQEVLIEQ